MLSLLTRVPAPRWARRWDPSAALSFGSCLHAPRPLPRGCLLPSSPTEEPKVVKPACASLLPKPCWDKSQGLGFHRCAVVHQGDPDSRCLQDIANKAEWKKVSSGNTEPGMRLPGLSLLPSATAPARHLIALYLYTDVHVSTYACIYYVHTENNCLGAWLQVMIVC